MGSRAARLFLFVAMVLAVVGCGGSSDPPNVLLVTLDTTRADHLGCYGYDEPTTPFIDRLAAEGVLFEKAFTTNPITLPAHSSIMTGTYPLYHGVRDNSAYVLREDVTTLAEVLQGHGYDTGAFISAFVLDGLFNLDQGFATYDDQVNKAWSRDEIAANALAEFGFTERKANQVSAAALEWLGKERSEPWFAWLHYFDPHEPLNPPEPHHSRFSEGYDAEIAYVDEQLGKVFEALERRGEAENTLVVVTADHGEGRLDHEEPTHSLFIYDSTLHVPLIFKVPGDPGGRRVPSMVSVVDVMPTVLDLLGLEAPEQIQGVSLRPMMDGGAGVEEREIYVESLVGRLNCGWGELRGLRTDEEKLIHGPEPRYYRVGEDPGEIYDLAAKDPEPVTRISDRLERALRRWAVPEAGRSISAADQETLSKLAALGYLGAAAGASHDVREMLETDGARKDPHAYRRLFDLYGIALENLDGGQPLEGIRTLEGIVAVDPGFSAALTALGMAYFRFTRQPQRARELFERSLSLDPNQEKARFFLARIFMQEGEVDRAREQFEAILEFKPRSIAALYELGRIYAGRGDPERGLDHFTLALELDPTSVPVLLALGSFHARRKLHDEAGEFYHQAENLEPDNPEILYNMGIWHLQGNDTQNAYRYLEKAVAGNPQDTDAMFVLGRLAIGREDWETARRVLQRAQQLAINPARLSEIERLLGEIPS